MGGPVLTVVTATIPPESQEEVLSTYRLVTSAATIPPAVLNTQLLRGEDDEWSIVTKWRSREHLEQYHRSVETQGAIELFRAAGGDPRVTTFDVLHETPEMPDQTGAAAPGLD
jgi:heme-degrading monooxygenase HmoA